MWRLIVLLAALGFGVAAGYLWPNPAPDGPLAAVVLEVLAPDTVIVLLPVTAEKGKKVTVHLRGITPPADREKARAVAALLRKALVHQPVVLEAVHWHWLGDAIEARVLRHGTDDVTATLLRGGWVERVPDTQNPNR